MINIFSLFWTSYVLKLVNEPRVLAFALFRVY